jgi:hypothetical protein
MSHRGENDLVSTTNSIKFPLHLPTNSSLFVYVKQLGNCAKKSLDGCDGTMTNFPIASASATVVHKTSEVDGLMKIFTRKIASEQLGRNSNLIKLENIPCD